MKDLNVEQLMSALGDTLYMTFVSLFFAVIIGLIIGLILYGTQKNGLFQNTIIFKILDVIVNVLRAVPFIILLINLVPVTKLLVGTMLGPTAALPPLILSAAPFFARLCMIAFNEVDKGTVEASKAMGATNKDIILKVIIPESSPAIISAIAVTAISLIGYTAMAGAIGSGGLGNLAYLYGISRHNYFITYVATIIIVVIVFIIQAFGDRIVKKIDKR